MSDKVNLKEKYILAKCCNPTPEKQITGYFSHDDIIKVHSFDCENLKSTDSSRLVQLEWDSIIETSIFKPDNDYQQLDEIDFKILSHHKILGIDYSAMVAKDVRIDKQLAFERHKKLKHLKLIKRVEALMVQYRKGIVDNKWIKHRNHTYYDLTPKGKQYIEHYLNIQQ